MERVDTIMKKVAIVTGASRGIGATTAKLLAENGYEVCVNYRNAKAKAEALVDAIKNNQGKAIAVQADMSSEADVIKLFERVDKELGPVNALVNNAGVNGGICEVESITTERLQSVFATNVFGTFIACREAAKRMKQHGGGCIVNISSESAKFGGSKMAHYSSSKAAINTFTIAVAREFAPFNIRVNAVSPGVIDTELHQLTPPDVIANLLKTLPMGRMGTTKELAESILWLLSDKASYVTGSILSITGAR